MKITKTIIAITATAFLGQTIAMASKTQHRDDWDRTNRTMQTISVDAKDQASAVAYERRSGGSSRTASWVNVERNTRAAGDPAQIDKRSVDSASKPDAAYSSKEQNPAIEKRQKIGRRGPAPERNF